MEAKSASPLIDKLPDRDTIERAAQTAHDWVDQAAAKAAPALDRLRSTAGTAADTWQTQAQNLGEMEAQWVESIRSYVRDNPLTAIGVGLLAGLVISRALR